MTPRLTVAPRPAQNVGLTVRTPTPAPVRLDVQALSAAGAPRDAVTFSQTAPAAVWLIDHALPHLPAVTVIDSAGSEVHGQVEYPSPTRVRLSFSAPFSGTAVLI